MGAAGRALIALGFVSVASCASPLALADTPKSFVPWQPLPAAHQYIDPATSPPAAPAVPPGTSRCVAAQLEGVGLAAGIAAGNVDTPLLLRNKGAVSCYLHGFVDVTVLDRRGRMLANAEGAAGRGTFFSDGPVTDVWMPAATPSLPKPFQTRDGRTGQAFMNFSWYDCQRPLAAAIEMALPDGGGTLRMPYVVQASVNPYCQSEKSTFKAISRGPLSPAGSLSPYLEVDVKLTAPLEAKRGTSITYYVTLTNTGVRDYDMQPCPDYIESFNGKQFPATYQLNCSPVGKLSPAASVTFQMEFDVPSSMSPGAQDLSWYLADGRLEPAGASTPLTIS
jgi:hypothetical protein